MLCLARLDVDYKIPDYHLNLKQKSAFLNFLFSFIVVKYFIHSVLNIYAGRTCKNHKKCSASKLLFYSSILCTQNCGVL